MTTNDDIHRSLGKIEGKLDSVLTRMDKHETRIDGHDAELGKVKGSIKLTRGWMMGLPIIGAAVGWFIGRAT